MNLGFTSSVAMFDQVTAAAEDEKEAFRRRCQELSEQVHTYHSSEISPCHQITQLKQLVTK